MLHTSSTRVRCLSRWSPWLACAGLALAAGACGDDSSTPHDAWVQDDAPRLDAATPDASPPDAIPDAAPPLLIDEARALADGIEVTVAGHVTVAPGTFNSATGEQGFAIQDETGGIYVKMTEEIELALDTRVLVTGTLDELAQLRVIDAAATGVTMLPGAQSIAPAAVATGDVDEDVEGRLIKVSGSLTRAVEEDPPYGLQVYIDDGSGEIQVFVHLVDGIGVIDTGDLGTGDDIEVVGLAAQYETTYEVAPRQASDLVVVPPAVTRE
jgi:DNA/RNA endonuclease YhcR with UshA esterase domain